MTWTITDTSYLVCIVQSSFEWCQWLSDLEVDLYYMLYMSPYDLMLHEERYQCFTCIPVLTKSKRGGGGGGNNVIVNTLKFKIESHFLKILRMVHFLPPVLVLVQLLLIICHALVWRHDAMETLYPGPFCQNLVITCISIETRTWQMGLSLNLFHS